MKTNHAKSRIFSIQLINNLYWAFAPLVAKLNKEQGTSLEIYGRVHFSSYQPKKIIIKKDKNQRNYCSRLNYYFLYRILCIVY